MSDRSIPDNSNPYTFIPASSTPDSTGLLVRDIELAYSARPLRHHSPAHQREGLQRIAHAFVQDPQAVLQTLVTAAVELCDADSAGISIQREDCTETEFYHWVATAGDYTAFLNAILPREPSACSICLERGSAQHFIVDQRFFDILGVTAPLVTDGILLPWQVDGTRGTIFVMAHSRTHAFDLEDCRLMETFADFAALAIRQQKAQTRLLEHVSAAAAASMANDLAHKINNPLQSLTNILFLATDSQDPNLRRVGHEASAELSKLSSLVSQLLALPLARQ